MKEVSQMKDNNLTMKLIKNGGGSYLLGNYKVCRTNKKLFLYSLNDDVTYVYDNSTSIAQYFITLYEQRKLKLEVGEELEVIYEIIEAVDNPFSYIIRKNDNL